MIRALNPRTVAHVAGAAVLLGMMAIPGSASAAPRPPENPVCRPLAATVEHWLPILDHAAPNLPDAWNTPTPGLQRYPWVDAASAVDYYADPLTLHWLNRWINEAVTSILALGTVNAHASPASLHQALTHIRSLCPSLPASVVNGPLPR